MRVVSRWIAGFLVGMSISSFFIGETGDAIYLALLGLTLLDVLGE